MKLPHTEAKFYPEVKSQTSLSLQFYKDNFLNTVEYKTSKESNDVKDCKRLTFYAIFCHIFEPQKLA